MSSSPGARSDGDAGVAGEDRRHRERQPPGHRAGRLERGEPGGALVGGADLLQGREPLQAAVVVAAASASAGEPTSTCSAAVTSTPHSRRTAAADALRGDGGGSTITSAD